MQQEVSKGTMIAAIIIAVVLLGGLGWWFTFGRTPANVGDAQPVSPPGGSYGGAASGPGAMRRPAGQ